MSNPNAPKDPGHNDEVPIIVNGRQKKWGAPEISFEQVVQIAFPDAAPNPNRIYTVNYKKGSDQGSLVSGESVAVRPGTIFNVSATDKS